MVFTILFYIMLKDSPYVLVILLKMSTFYKNKQPFLYIWSMPEISLHLQQFLGVYYFGQNISFPIIIVSHVARDRPRKTQNITLNIWQAITHL